MWLPTVLLLSSNLWVVISILLGSNHRHKEESTSSIIELDAPKRFNYNEAERNALLQFRAMLDDGVLEKEHDRADQFLIRWIRVWNFDLKEAEQRLRQTMRWRKQNNMDTILEEKPLELPIGQNICDVQGISYAGNPIYTIKLIKYDVRKWLLAGIKHNITRLIHQCIERVVVTVRNLTEETGYDISEGIALIDVSGYTVKQHACPMCMSLYLDILRESQYNLPAYVKLAVVVNAPLVARPFFEILKATMHSALLSRVHIFGNEKKEWSEFLLKYIAPDQLSSHFGGSATW